MSNKPMTTEQIATQLEWIARVGPFDFHDATLCAIAATRLRELESRVDTLGHELGRIMGEAQEMRKRIDSELPDWRRPCDGK